MGHDVPVSADTRLAKLDEAEMMPVPRAIPAGADGDLVRWAYAAREAHQIAIALSKTQFVPATMQGKPHDITAAILAGHELGMQPMAALRSIDIIYGTPALRAHAMRGLLQSRGHKLTLVEASPTRVVMEGQRYVGGGWAVGPGSGAYDEPVTVEWTMERAIQMGLPARGERAEKAGKGPGPWKLQPQTMLIARATSELARLIASDVLFAMPYAVEEIEHDERDGATPQERAVTIEELTTPYADQPRKRRAAAKDTTPYRAPFIEGPLVDQPLPFDEDDATTEPPSSRDDWPPTAEVAP